MNVLDKFEKNLFVQSQKLDEDFGEVRWGRDGEILYLNKLYNDFLDELELDKPDQNLGHEEIEENLRFIYSNYRIDKETIEQFDNLLSNLKKYDKEIMNIYRTKVKIKSIDNSILKLSEKDKKIINDLLDKKVVYEKPDNPVEIFRILIDFNFGDEQLLALSYSSFSNILDIKEHSILLKIVPLEISSMIDNVSAVLYNLKARQKSKQHFLSRLKCKEEIDPITQERFEDMTLKELATIIIVDGVCYTKDSIYNWVIINPTNPMTGLELMPEDVLEIVRHYYRFDFKKQEYMLQLVNVSETETSFLENLEDELTPILGEDTDMLMDMYFYRLEWLVLNCLSSSVRDLIYLGREFIVLHNNCFTEEMSEEVLSLLKKYNAVINRHFELVSVDNYFYYTSYKDFFKREKNFLNKFGLKNNIIIIFYPESIDPIENEGLAKWFHDLLKGCNIYRKNIISEKYKLENKSSVTYYDFI